MVRTAAMGWVLVHQLLRAVAAVGMLNTDPRGADRLSASLGFLQYITTDTRLDCAPATGSLTLKTTSDISSLIACSTFTGNIVVAADGPSTIDLSGLIAVSGNIDVENVSNLTSLSSTTLTTVSSFTLNNLPVLSKLSFPALSNFSSLKWYDLPKLEGCVITTGALEGEIQEISILNTGIKELDWLTWPVGSQLNISGNANLENFSIPYNSINAGSALTLRNNSALSSIDVSQVSGIYGGLQVADNSALKDLEFEKLESIGGFVQLSGGFANISMPALNGINGALRVEATGDISSLCSSLESKNLNGHYDCTANSQNTVSQTTTGAAQATPTSTSTGNGNGNSDGIEDNGSGSEDGVTITKKQAAGIAVAAIFFTLLSIGITIWILRRRSGRKVQEITKSNRSASAKTLSSDSIVLHPSTFDTNTPNSPTELDSPAVALEMGAGKRWTNTELPAVVPVEMEGSHGVSEVTGKSERHELPG
jgi:hypothetical protein